jgi:hypothetical protein
MPATALVHFYTKKTLYGLLEEAGYRIVTTDFTTGVTDLASLRNARCTFLPEPIRVSSLSIDRRSRTRLTALGSKFKD